MSLCVRQHHNMTAIHCVCIITPHCCSGVSLATFELTQRCACSDWGEVGRKPYATVSELKTIAKQELSMHGATVGKADLAWRLTKFRDTQLEEAGFSTTGNFTQPH